MKFEQILPDFGAVCGFEDPEDCALFNDATINSALSNIEAGTLLESDIDDYDEPIDTDIDYSGIPSEATAEDMEADDYINAAREEINPGMDEEEIDIALGDLDDIPEDF